MTITEAASAPLFAVVGATGIQGRSVIDAIVASKIAYRVRGLMRSTARAGDLPSLGVEAVSADASDPSSLRKAFEGAKYVSAMTITDFDDYGNEVQQGKNLVGAAKAAGVKTFVFSSLMPLGKRTGGKPAVPSYDYKSQVEDYARATAGDMVIKTVIPGWYISNWWNFVRPAKQQDGTFVWSLPLPADSALPFSDTEYDFGRFVLAALQDGSPDEILAGGHYRSPDDTVSDLSSFANKAVKYHELSSEEWLESATAAFGANTAKDMLATCQAIASVGYYGGASLECSNNLLATPPRTILQSLEANKQKVMDVLA